MPARKPRPATDCRIEPATGDDYFYYLNTSASPPTLARGKSFGFDCGVIARSGNDGSVVGAVMLIEFSPVSFEGAGTWVAPDHRRQGLAVEMWSFLFDRIRSDATVSLLAVSPEGLALGMRLAQIFGPTRVSVFAGDEWPDPSPTASQPDPARQPVAKSNAEIAP